MLRYKAPLLQLPIRFDVDRLRRDADQFPPHLWSPDRLASGVPGAYTTLALVAHRGRENDEMFGPFEPSPFLAACPYFRQVIASFDAPVCEVRLRWLGPHASGAFHFDRHRLLEDRHRVHVPIYTTPHAHFHCADRVATMAAGSAWTFDRMRRHSVFNDDPTIGRLHLIMDFRPSDELRRLIDRSAESLDEVSLLRLDDAREPRFEFERECPPAVWSSGRLRDEIAELRGRFADDSRFAAMESATQDLLSRWSAIWQRHGDARTGWPHYQKLARGYYARWRSLVPIRDVADERSETSWIACLLDTGAYVPSRARKAPSWSPNEALRLVDTTRITIGVDGTARISLDGGEWRPIAPSVVSAILAIVHGASPKSLRAALGRKDYEEALPTLRWLAEARALRVDDEAHQLDLLFGPSARSAAGGDLVVPPATMARLVSLRDRVTRASRFRPRAELHFLVKTSGAVGAYLPDARGFDLLFPDALAIAQHMALGLSVDEIAHATGYRSSDDFLLFIAWLWDVLPLTCEDDAQPRRPSFVERLHSGEAMTLPTLAPSDPVHTVTALAEIGPHAIILDSSGPCSPASIRRAASIARVKHVDVLVKTSRRVGVAEICDLPIAGLVLADCDADMLREVARALAGREESRPFVLGVIESVHALDELDAIASSRWIDALVVGAGDLARDAVLSGVDPGKAIARAHERVRRLASRHEKHWAVVVGDAREETRARERGARLILRGSDVTVLSDGIRALTLRSKRRSSPLRRT